MSNSASSIGVPIKTRMTPVVAKVDGSARIGFQVEQAGDDLVMD